MEKLATTRVEINELLARRWSRRSYDPDKEVTEEQIISLCEAARWAPSCFGDQPWKFIIWNKYKDEKNWSRAFNCLGEWNQNWVKNAPVLIAAIADTVFNKNGKENRWGRYDTGAASENLCLQAVDLGLAAHQMGGFDKDKLIDEFNVPDRYIPMAMIAVGYPADPEILEGEYFEAEYNKRERNPLGKNFFSGDWGEPII